MSHYDLSGKRVWVAGHTGMVGRALLRALKGREIELLTVGRGDVDLRRQDQVNHWIGASRPDVIFLAAGRVGGIEANRTQPADFLFDNLAIASNVITSAARNGTGRLLFLGSSCFYPRLANQPVAEDSLLTGPLEPTNEAYAVAKIAGAKLCEAFRRQHGCDFITAVPTNLYGPFDNFSPEGGHVVSGLIRKIVSASRSSEEEVEIWGTGSPVREFLYVDDAADAMVFLIENYSSGAVINIAGGDAVTIRDLASEIATVAGYKGAFRFDTSRPDGMPVKVLESSRIRALGWSARTGLARGLKQTVDWYRNSLFR